MKRRQIIWVNTSRESIIRLVDKRAVTAQRIQPAKVQQTFVQIHAMLHYAQHILQ